MKRLYAFVIDYYNGGTELIRTGGYAEAKSPANLTKRLREYCPGDIIAFSFTEFTPFDFDYGIVPLDELEPDFFRYHGLKDNKDKVMKCLPWNEKGKEKEKENDD